MEITEPAREDDRAGFLFFVRRSSTARFGGGMAAQLEKDGRDTRAKGPAAIVRADGITPAERLLKQLCDRSFLSMWSYSGIYRDQGRPNQKGDGKEVCDLVVVFEN